MNHIAHRWVEKLVPAPPGASVPPILMRRLPRLLALCALSIGLAQTSGCKRTQTSSDTSPGTTGSVDNKAEKPRRTRRKPGMPRPLRLPANAPIVVHVQAPHTAIAGLRAYSPQVPDGHTILQEIVRANGGGALEAKLAEAVDLQRPWDVASVDGQLIVHMPILAARVGAVAGLLADKPPVGRFGAVDLQRGSVPGPSLAWLDAKAATLTLASTERGLSTGRGLARAYGKKPLRIDLEGDAARTYVPEFALDDLHVIGAGVHDFTMEAKGVPPEIFARAEALQAGALTGLLESSVIAAGGSSRYAHHARDVKKVLADAKRQVDRQSFLVRGNLEDLLRRFGSFARSWNGRTMVGVGPANHLLVGVGADDPSKMGGALFHLTRGVMDNLSLARSIGIGVPKVRFQRNKLTVGSHNISVIALEKARKYLPSDVSPLVDDKGDLRICMAFPKRMGAGMFVLGAKCHTALAQWLTDIDKATDAKDSTEDFIAATLAINPTTAEPLLSGGTPTPAQLLGLSAEREPTHVVVRRDGDTTTVRVKGPEVKARTPHLGTRLKAARLRKGADAKAKGRAPQSKSSPSRAKPVRTKPAR